MKRFVTCLIAAALLLTSCSQLSGNESQSVLFIGNSYTYTNDLPSMVANVLDDNGIDLDVESITVGGANFTEHASNPTVRSTIMNGDFDIVILQDQSETPAIPRLLNDQSVPAAEALGTMADESGARVILFETWGHRNGSTFSGHTSYESMQSALTSGYWELAAAANGTVAPVGSTWSRSLATNDVVLHSADGSHPAPAGTHLASLVIARTILGEPLTSFPTNGIPDTEAEELAALLW